jgi:hypothetical protein
MMVKNIIFNMSLSEKGLGSPVSSQMVKNIPVSVLFNLFLSENGVAVTVACLLGKRR